MTFNKTTRNFYYIVVIIPHGYSGNEWMNSPITTIFLAFILIFFLRNKRNEKKRSTFKEFLSAQAIIRIADENDGSVPIRFFFFPFLIVMNAKVFTLLSVFFFFYYFSFFFFFTQNNKQKEGKREIIKVWNIRRRPHNKINGSQHLLTHLELHCWLVGGPGIGPSLVAVHVHKLGGPHRK